MRTMAPVRKSNSVTKSCSCTSCLYKSESEQLIFKDYVAQGSRIDRLYYGKYIPLRERNLLNRLVRTRAVYDDLRARLISDSTLSLDRNADLRPGKNQHVRKSLNPKISGALLELVNAIDKGRGTASKNIRECCNCCSCSSESRILAENKQEQARKKPYARTFGGKHRRMRQIIYSRKFEPHKRKRGETVPGRNGDRYTKRGVRFKTKRFRSEPCICTFKFSNLMNRNSNAMLKKSYYLPLEEPSFRAKEQNIIEKSKKQSLAQQSIQKYKDLKHKLEQDLGKFNNSRTSLKRKLQVHGKKSVEKVKHIKNKIKRKLEFGTRKSMQVEKNLSEKGETIGSSEYPAVKTTFGIKKDSIIKFKDYLKKKDIMKDVECDLECEPDICVPEKCFRTIKLRRLKQRNHLLDRIHAERHGMINENLKDVKTPLRRSNSGVQTDRFGVTTLNRRKKQKPLICSKDKNQSILVTEKANKEDMKQSMTKRAEKSDESFITSAIQDNNAVNKRQILDNTSPDYTISPLIQPSGIHVRTPKQIDNKVHHRRNKIVSTITQCKCKKRLGDVKSNTDYGTKSVSCLANNTGRATIDKKINTRVVQGEQLSQIPFSPSRQDTSKSMINKKYSYDKQAVRISSTLSFNIEFRKNFNKNETKTALLQKNVEQPRNNNIHFGHKVVQAAEISAKAYNHAKTTLRRCFCARKLHGHEKAVKKFKTSKTASVMCSCESKALVPLLIDKYVETKHNNHYQAPKDDLLPYLCEPDICNPEECKPTFCKKILAQLRDKRVSKSVGSYTGSRKTKSTSSIISRTFNTAKPKYVQSSIIPVKSAKTGASNKYNENIHLKRNRPGKINVNFSRRQAARIGSTFSFNIEFYKDEQSPAGAKTNNSSFSNQPLEKNHKQRRNKIVVDVQDKCLNKSTHRNRTKEDKNKEPFKMCLCTLKLYKNKILKKETVKKLLKSNRSTQTFGENLVGENVNKGTKAKKGQKYKFPPYECEPHFCTPGECHPYLCHEEIKRRQMYTRDISAFTDISKMRQKSSLTENSFSKSKSILVQPTRFALGIDRKGGNLKELYSKIRPSKESFKGFNSTQIVKLGSSFDASIEFMKQLPGAVILTKSPKKVHSKIGKDKGITFTKVRVNHVDTQVMKPKEVNRALLVRPMLRRCFCTLNLQKKTKIQNEKSSSTSEYFGPKVYTIGRALTEIIYHSSGSLPVIKPKSKIISLSTSSFLLNKYGKRLTPKFGNLNLYSLFKTPTQLKQTFIIRSNLTMNVDILRQMELSNKNPILKKLSYSSLDENTVHCLKLSGQLPDPSVKNLSYITKYLEQCFCTMNIRISNKDMLRKRNDKLKPYECEPSICISSECKPYECKKLIMRRLVKNVQKKTGTDPTNKSVSSDTTSYVRSSSRNTDMETNFRTHTLGTVRQKYKRPQQNKPKQKQDVHISSSRSFDLEFFKNKYSRHQSIIDIKKPLSFIVQIASIGAQGEKIYGKDSKFQVSISSVHRATDPMNKQCFCFLKLQKKGSMNNNARINSNSVHTKQTQPAPISRNVKIGNNNLPKIPIISNHLTYYQCEPGKCVPGLCSPYKCLELIKHRKDIGINTIQSEKNSVSSITSKKYLSGKYKTRAVDVRTNETHEKYTKNIEKGNAYSIGQDSRQAVRIGSNFSFNIKFFKDIPQVQPYTDRYLQKLSISNSNSTKDRKVFMPIVPSNNDNVSPGNKGIEEAFNNEFNNRSKRNFNTKIFHSIDDPGDRTINTFKHRCYCLFGLSRIENKENTIKKESGLQNRDNNEKSAIKPVRPVGKRTNTSNKQNKKKYLSHLNPYECEPKACVPGQCDSLLCQKIILQRNAKHNSKRFETESARIHSVTSSYEKDIRLKNGWTQTLPQSHQKEKHNLSNYLSLSGKTTFNAEKRLMRIGSNLVREVKPHRGTRAKKSIVSNKNIGIETTKRLNERSSESQVENKRTKAFGISPLLKRCFCTLKLRKQLFTQTDVTARNKQIDTKPIVTTKTVKTQSNKRFNVQQLQNNFGEEYLPSYECEPFICVPGECDSVECLKQLKRKQEKTKELGTITKHPKRKSIGNVAVKKKHESLQANPEKSRSVQNYDQPRHAVRVGSNFNSNIDFFKETRDDTSYMQSSITTMPNLKRCFCTLPLRNNPVNKTKIQSFHPYSGYSSIGRFFKNCMCALQFNKIGKYRNQPLTPAVKYEIKGTSTRNRHAHDLPKKSARNVGFNVCEPYVCTPGKCNPFECLKRSQQRQVREFSTSYVRDYATDSIRQPVTRSVKAQYQKQKLISRGTSSALKHRRRSAETSVPFSPSPDHGTKRQVVNIGSSFSFNIEFFKDYAPASIEYIDNKEGTKDKVSKIKTLQSKHPNKPRPRRRFSISSVRRLQNKSSQLTYSKRPGMYFATNNTPEKCFCTMSLLKISNRLKTKGKSLRPAISTKDNMTGIKDKFMIPHDFGVFECPPFMCVPDECKPYGCLDKIKRRKIIRKSSRVGTGPKRTSVSVGSRASNLKNHKNQTSKIRTIVSSTANSQINKKSHKRNKSAVKVRSSFTLKFLKQNSQPAVFPIFKKVKERHNKENSNSYVRKKIAAEAKKFRHNNSQTNGTKVKRQASNAGKLLKRCFCTLQLQKYASHRIEPVNMHRPRNAVIYPQIFTVGRVAVEPLLKSDKNTNTSRKIYKTRSTSINPKRFKKTIGTKTGKKYLSNAENLSYQCDRYVCPYYRKICSKTDTSYAIETIFPYTPRKFDKKESRTCVTYKNQFKNRSGGIRQEENYDYNKHDTSQPGKSKRRLAAAKSKISIPTLSLVKKPNCKISFFCKCFKYIYRTSKTISEAFGNRENISSKNKGLTKSKSVHSKIELKVLPRQVKNISKNVISMENTIDFINNTLKIQNGNVKTATIKIHKVPEKFNKNKSKSQEGAIFDLNRKMRVTFADCSKCSKNNICKRKCKYFMHSKSSTQSKLCSPCSLIVSPFKFVNLKRDQEKSDDINVLRKSTIKNKNPVSYIESVDCCQYCDCCKRKIDANEICKGGGDRRLTISPQYKVGTNMCALSTKPDYYNERNNSYDSESKSTKIEPLLKMHLDSVNHDIINISDVKKTLDQFSNNKLPKNKKISPKKHNTFHDISKIVPDEICKGGGDRCLAVECKVDANRWQCDKKSVEAKIKKYLFNKKASAGKRSLKDSQSKYCFNKKNLLKKSLDLVNSSTIHKRKTKQTIDQLGKSAKTEQNRYDQDNLCSCCKCVTNRKMQGAMITVAANGTKNIAGAFQKLFFVKKAPGPCTCGSTKCAVESKKRKTKIQKIQKGFIKPCVCGSNICPDKNRRLKKQNKLTRNKTKSRFQSVTDKRNRKALENRIKIRDEKDRIRRIKRIKRNIELERKVKKNKEASDLMLATDNLIDIGKLGVSSLTGLLRYTAHSFADPQVAYERLRRRCRNKNPEAVTEQLIKDFKESDATATLRRMKKRCSYMHGVQTLKEKLERNPVTHFIMHIADKNPKTRKYKPKPRRRTREPLDFHCSLYMATLRKRPCLCIYYKCPWFYPHFMTLVNVWKQFTDVILLLLAAVVWSPCILCMECCRALMCCFFCTS